MTSSMISTCNASKPKKDSLVLKGKEMLMLEEMHRRLEDKFVDPTVMMILIKEVRAI